jgi:hypothetical protein
MNDPYGFGNPNPPPPTYGYGQSGFGQEYPPPPGPQGYVSYGQGAAPPHIYVPTAMNGQTELRSLEDNAQLWLLVVAAGFWFGFGWITGPLAWYQGSKIRSQYRAHGHHPCASANWAWGLGIASTLFYWGTILMVTVGLAIAFGLLI